MNARLLSMLALALAMLIVTGCGGDDDDEPTEAAPVATTPTTTLTKEELLTQGDAICAEVNAAIGTVGTADTESAALVEQEADLYSGMVDRLKALGIPDEASGYEEFIAAAEGLAEAEEDAGLAAAREDSVALQNAQSDVSSAFTAFQEAAGEYGFEECGNAPSAPAAAGAGAPTEAEGEAVEEEGEVEAAPEEEAEVAPEEAGGAGAGGGAEAGGGSEAGGGTESGGGGSAGGIGPG
jgi:uncharacterized membrane protein YgcG